MKNLIVSLLKLQAKFVKRDRVVDVFSTFTDARSIMILMPDILEDFGIARKFLRKLTESFSKAKLHLVMRSSFKNLLDGSLYHGTIFVADRDANYMGLPKKDLKQRILATKFDIAIDFNNNFHLLSTYLSHLSGAKLRICLDHSDREPFYNFCFRSQPHKDLEDKYNRFVSYLCGCVNPEKGHN